MPITVLPFDVKGQRQDFKDKHVLKHTDAALEFVKTLIRKQ